VSTSRSRHEERNDADVEDGLGLMVDRLLAAEFTENEVHTMAVADTRRLAGGGRMTRVRVIGAHYADFVVEHL
jgi:hypothetical protein